MPGLTWGCACGTENPASAPTCTMCGRVPGLAPLAEVEVGAKVDRPAPRRGGDRRRRALPFSANGRRGGADPNEQPEPTFSRLPQKSASSSPSVDPVGLPSQVTPSSGPADHSAAVGAPGVTASAQPAPETSPATGAAPAEKAPVTGVSPGDKAVVAPPEKAPKARAPSFFDPEPEQVTAAAGPAKRRQVTPTLIIAVVCIAVALAVLAFVVVTTGNSKPPNQGSTTSMGRVQAPVAAIPPVQDSKSAA